MIHTPRLGRLFLALALGASFGSAAAADLTVTPSTDATAMANALLGNGVTVVGTPTLISEPNQSGLFSGGGAISLGIESGVVLTSGDARKLPGINQDATEDYPLGFDSSMNFNVDLGTSGFAELDALVGTTVDGAALEFQFQIGDGSQPGQVFMNFVFGSDEYLEQVGAGVNDVFVFSVDGVNIALVPATTDPVSVGTVNPDANAAFYRNNIANIGGFPVADVKVALDGMTRVLRASTTVGPGVHTMRFAIADARDGSFDSAVFLQGGSFADTAIPTGYALGGSVTGLSGSVTLQNSGRDDLIVSADGSFTFPTELPDGVPYVVTVKTQPSGQTCTVSNGSGSIAGAAVSNVAVSCVNNFYPIGGVLSGLAPGGTVVLRNNGGDDLTLGANGAFSFPTPIVFGGTYAVTVQTQPAAPSETCTVGNGSGTVAGAVSSVTVTCTLTTFTVGGNVSGLAAGAQLGLQINGGGTQTLSASGGFSFPPLADGSAYSVTVSSQPLGQTCAVTGGSGTLSGGNVSNVVVSCSNNAYTLGGVLSGLASGDTVVLQNSGGETLSLGANGTFSFVNQVTFGNAYSVTVLTQPPAPSQACTVRKGSGSMPPSDLNNVSVVCSLNSFTVGGTVTGLAGGASVTLRLNGADDRVLTSSGNFLFSALADGTAYTVTVASQPIGQTCVVTGGSGTLSGSDVSSVDVSCSNNSYTLGGVLTGLASGDSVVLQNSGGDNLTLSANGAFSFATPVTFGDGYNVTVLTQPPMPSETCTVRKGTGSMPASDLNNVNVICTLNTFTVGGAVSGLAGGGTLVLRLNGADDQTLTASGNFSFSPLADGTPYSVTIAAQPTGQTCAVTSGSGSLAGANVTSVAVSCTNNVYTLGGTLSGLPTGASVVLQNNGGDNLTLAANGAFTFSVPVAFGAGYSVLVLTQPTSPSATCAVNNGSGVMPAGNVTNVAVTCAINTFTVGGAVSGLAAGASVVLRINGADERTLTASGPFTFSPLPDGSAYVVSVATQPLGQACTVTNGSGTLTGANVSNVAVSCVTNTTTTYTAASPTGTGSITAAFSGAGVGAACTLATSQFLSPPPGAAPVPPVAPPNVVFPHGLFDFALNSCTNGATVTFTLTYPQPLPPGTRYLNYGPTATNPTPHWYALPATVVGNTVTFSIADGGLGDSDLTANGAIVATGGAGASTLPAVQVPTTSTWILMLMSLLLVTVGAARVGRVR